MRPRDQCSLSSPVGYSMLLKLRSTGLRTRMQSPACAASVSTEPSPGLLCLLTLKSTPDDGSQHIQVKGHDVILNCNVLTLAHLTPPSPKHPPPSRVPKHTPSASANRCRLEHGMVWGPWGLDHHREKSSRFGEDEAGQGKVTS